MRSLRMACLTWCKADRNITNWAPKKKLSLDDNQKVYIENQPILGDGAGEGA